MLSTSCPTVEAVSSGTRQYSSPQVALQIRSINARYHRTGTQSYSYGHRAQFRYVLDRPVDDHMDVTTSLM